MTHNSFIVSYRLVQTVFQLYILMWPGISKVISSISEYYAEMPGINITKSNENIHSRSRHCLRSVAKTEVKMQFIPVFLACLTVAFAQEYYPSKFDNINIKEIIDNTRLFTKYKECVLQEKATRCPQGALELKKVFPEALDTLCAKCTSTQIDKIREGLSYACKKRRADYDEILRHVDPQAVKVVAFEQKFGKIDC